MTLDLDSSKFYWNVGKNKDGTVSCWVEIERYYQVPELDLYWKLTWDKEGGKLIRRTLYRGKEPLFTSVMAENLQACNALADRRRRKAI